MKQFFFSQVFFAAACYLASSAAVEITQPFPTNINALSGTRQSTTCHATGQGQPPDLVKFVIKEGYNKPRGILSKGRVYQTKAVIKGNTMSVSLHFENITVGDQSQVRKKIYECRVYANANATYDDRWQIQITVVSPSDLPKISYTDSMNATKGSTATLNCSVVDPGEGGKFSFKEMKWLKNGKELKKVLSSELLPLTIEGVNASDGGEYRCTLRIGLELNSQFDYNITGDAIDVNVPVYLTKGDEEIEAAIGDNVTFECSAEGYPLNVVWRKVLQNKEIEILNITGLSQRVSYRKECPTCHFKMDIVNVTEEIGGKYLCRTVNSVGNVKQQFTLQVGESPTPTSSSVRTESTPTSSSARTAAGTATFLMSMLFFCVL